MQWFVYREDVNSRKIGRVNILKNYDGEIKKLKKKSTSYEDFCALLNSEMMWHYWSKCEHEVIMCVTDDSRIVLKPWVDPKGEVKPIDVTDDGNFDWKDFAEECAGVYVNVSDGIKIDVYDQLKYRWDDFCEYCWNFGR